MRFYATIHKISLGDTVDETEIKYILSRKGIDDEFGGNASPILPDGTMISIPIPGSRPEMKYDALQLPQTVIHTLRDNGIEINSYNELMAQLEIFPKLKKNPIETCHLDPDLRIETWPNRDNNWRGIFGQDSRALSHLYKQNVRIGDIFLFFGTFRHTKITDGKIDFVGSRLHVIFGYLKINDIISDTTKWCPKWIINSNFEPWMSYHDHAQPELRNKKKNCIFAARYQKPLDVGLKDYGVFKFDKRLVLTREDQGNKSYWRQELFADKQGQFNPGFRISWHGENFKGKLIDGAFHSTGKGQEFVISPGQRFRQYVNSLWSLVTE